MNGKTKLSVYLDDELHQQLKVASAKRRTSLQKVMEEAAKMALGSEAETEIRTQEDLSLRPVSSKDVRDWLAMLKEILESGNDLAILNCTTSIRAMKVWLNERKEHDAAVIPFQPLVPQPTSAQPKTAQPKGGASKIR